MSTNGAESTEKTAPVQTMDGNTQAAAATLSSFGEPTHLLVDRRRNDNVSQERRQWMDKRNEQRKAQRKEKASKMSGEEKADLVRLHDISPFLFYDDHSTLLLLRTFLLLP